MVFAELGHRWLQAQMNGAISNIRFANLYYCSNLFYGGSNCVKYNEYYKRTLHQHVHFHCAYDFPRILLVLNHPKTLWD